MRCERPRLSEIGLQLDKLGIRILKHLLVVLVPFFAECHVAQRQHIGRFAERGLPIDGVFVFLGTRIGEGILHLGQELVLHGHEQIGIGVEYRCKLLGHLLHVFIFQRERTELMHHRGCGLELVGQFARHDTALEKTRTIEGVGGSLDEG